MLRKFGNKRYQPWIWRKCRTLRSLKQIHGFMVIRGFLSDLSALRELIFCSAISVQGGTNYAYQVFDKIPQPDLFMWNTMIRGAAHTATPSNAISLYTNMEKSGTRPDNLTFPFLFRACTKLSSPITGAQFHAKIVKFGLCSDVFIRNALINLHANCGDLAVADALFDQCARQDIVAWSAMIAGYARRGEMGIARKLFDESTSKDLVSWNVMITAYAKRGEMEKARELFDRVPERDVVSWNAMIAGYVECGSHSHALELFDQMRHFGEQPDEITMLSLLSACADSGALDVGRRLHSLLSEKCSRTGMPVVLGNALIDMYAKCGKIDGSLDVFRAMRDKDVSTWNSIIGGLAFHGHVQESLHVFEEMLEEKVRPDEITFVGVLVACSHGGLVDEGRRCFSLMQNEYNVEPNIKHYGCMVDMLGRAGLLREAFEFVDKMKVEPNPVVWRTLLGACRIHGDVEFAERANEQLLKAKSDGSGDYVLLSNIYASVGEWHGSEKVRKLMDDSGVCKEAGHTLMEAEGREFVTSLLQSKPSSRLKGAVVI
ncbi:pentatricopeptide repeat-containing protein At5g15300 [Typha angustifolia]|uniref:pentatricopeptide repeat-containing protein At5g15300 n=1 Tax=Typha angustifolia TaxID=59011 RepID=UPI003C2ECD82